MEMLERYLRTVRSYLPKEQRDDIIRELSDHIRSRLEDREEELGRPLSEPEQEAILQRHGDPLVVASRYRRDQRSVAFGRQLIGPALFPLYVRVLALNLGATLFVCVVIALTLHGVADAASMVPAILTHLLLQFGIVTLVFAAADHHLGKSLTGDHSQPARSPETAGRRVSRLESFAELVVLAVFLLWLSAVHHSPQLVFNPDTAVLRLGPVWQQMYIPVVLVTLAGIVSAGVNLLRPDWTAFRAAARVAIAGGWLTIVVCLLVAGDWVVLADTAGDPAEDSRRAAAVVNQYVFFYALLVTGLVLAIHLLLEIRRLLRHRRPPGSGGTPSHGAIQQ
jgi:uncharacterized membrane protein